MRLRQILTVLAAPLLLAAGATAAFGEDLVEYEIVDGISIPESLTGKPGDPARGREVAIDRKLGNCLACHSLPIPEQPFHGTTGPDLSAAGSYLSEGELRLRIVDPKVINPNTMMPSFYKVDGFHRVAAGFQGKPILTAQQVEDVVAYLMTLKGD